MDYNTLTIYFLILFTTFTIIWLIFVFKWGFCEHVWVKTDNIKIYDIEDGEKYNHGCVFILQCKKCGNIKKLKI